MLGNEGRKIRESMITEGSESQDGVCAGFGSVKGCGRVGGDPSCGLSSARNRRLWQQHSDQKWQGG